MVKNKKKTILEINHLMQYLDGLNITIDLHSDFSPTVRNYKHIDIFVCSANK